MFFFQAEDGIRDLTVTGVQTCALPISRRMLWVTASSAMTLATVAASPSTVSPDRTGRRGRVLRIDRKSGVEGKRGELGGGRILKKKKKIKWSRSLEQI